MVIAATPRMEETPLSPDAVGAWISGISPDLEECARRMEEKEDWVPPPESSFYGALSEFVDRVSSHQGLAEKIVSDERLPAFVRVLAYLHARQSLRLLGLSGERQPGISGDMLRLCATLKVPGGDLEAHAKLLEARIAVAVKLQCYFRIFGPEQRASVLNILKKIHMEGRHAS